RFCLVDRGRRGVSQTCVGAFALGAVDGAMDRATPRRSAAVAMVELRRHLYQNAPPQDWRRLPPILVGAPLKAALHQAAMHKGGPLILVNSYGRPWTQGGFRSSWGDVCKKAGIADLTFNDLRGTAVTRLALVGCIEAEIASITGHSLRDV